MHPEAKGCSTQVHANANNRGNRETFAAADVIIRNSRESFDRDMLSIC